MKNNTRIEGELNENPEGGNKSFREIFEEIKSEYTLIEKIQDKLENVYYFLGGRYIDDFIYFIKNQFSGLVRFIKGQGYITDLEVSDFPSQSAKYILNRIRIIRNRIVNEESYCDWGETIKCLYPDEKEQDMVKILDDIIFAFEYINDDTEHIDYVFLQAYGYERGEALTAMFGELFDRESKIDKARAQADYNQFSNEGGLLDQLRQRKDKGLQLFAKYYETLWD